MLSNVIVDFQTSSISWRPLTYRSRAKSAS